MNESHFYNLLPPQHSSIAAIFREENFHPVPSSWYIIVTDVKNSTQAVAEGRHNDVNLVAAGSLIASLNVARKHGIEVPFFFGGDGSTVLVPQNLHEEVLGALQAHNQNTSKNFNLQMHMGSISMQQVLDNGCSIKLARLQMDAAYNKSVAIGNGMRYAEQKIKQRMEGEKENEEVGNDLNLSGLECRWNKIKPPVDEAENRCYLIEAAEPAKQLAVYAGIMQTIETIFGDILMRSPLSAEKLKPLYSLQKLKKEMMVKFGKWKPAYLLEAFFRTFFGSFYFRYNLSFGGLSGKEYLNQLIAHADTITIDGRISTIICGTPEKHQQFINYLEEQEKEGSLVFGQHASKESIMTCYIENRNQKHIHFVDGADGGYTEASKGFKRKWKKLETV